MHILDLPPDCQEKLIVGLPLHIAARLGQTCFELYQAYKRRFITSSQKCINDFKLPFDETINFLRLNNSIFSGLAVLSMIDPNLVDAADMDMYVPRGKMETAHAFLTRFSFQLVQRDAAHNVLVQRAQRSPTGIHEVRYYVQRVHNTVINVIETMAASTPSAVFLFHSTVVMNYMTWNAIVSAYPITTSLRCGLVNSLLPRHEGRMLRCLGKYKDRGYRFMESSLECPDLDEDHGCGAYGYCPLTARHIGNKSTMRLTLRYDAEPDVELVDDNISWQLACKSPECGSQQYRPSAGWVESGCGDVTEITSDMIEEYE